MMQWEWTTASSRPTGRGTVSIDTEYGPFQKKCSIGRVHRNLKHKSLDGARFRVRGFLANDSRPNAQHQKA